jgi:hypothetical protein
MRTCRGNNLVHEAYNTIALHVWVCEKTDFIELNGSLTVACPALHGPQQYRKAANSPSWTIAVTHT